MSTIEVDNISPRTPGSIPVIEGHNRKPYDSVADVVANATTDVGATIRTAGYYVAGDGGGALYHLDPADNTTADDGFLCIVATSDNSRWKLEVKGPIDPRVAGAYGDGATDDRAAIQKVIDYVGSVGPDFEDKAGQVIDLGGAVYGIGDSLVFDGFSNVRIQSGTLLAVGSWTSSKFILDYTHTGTYKEAMNNSLNNVTVNGNLKCNGVYLQNTKRFRMEDCNVSRFFEYGVRTSLHADGANGELILSGVTCTQVNEGTGNWLGYQIEAGVGDSNGRGVGFSIRSADFMMDECLAFATMVCMELDSQSNGQISNCHFFSSNRTTNNTGMVITGAADNGSGGIRLTMATNHLAETDDLIHVKDVGGTTEANTWWKVTKINATQVDLQGSTFTNAYTSGGTFHPHNYVLQVGVKDSEVQGIQFSNCYFDAQPAVLWNSFDLTFVGCMFVAGGTDASKLTMVATDSNETGDGLALTSCRFKENPELAASEGGSWNSNPTIFFMGNRRALTGGVARLLHTDGSNVIFSNGQLSMNSEGDVTMTNFTNDFTTLNFARGLRLSADFDSNSGGSASNIEFATDNTVRFTISNTGIAVGTDETMDLGGTVNRMRQVYTGRVGLIDGITAPGTIAGHAQLFVDSADGSLKVKFGDGVVKTITTDV